MKIAHRSFSSQGATHALSGRQKKIAELQAEAARITESQLSEAIAKAKEIIDKFGLTAQQLGLRATRGARGDKRKATKRAGAGVPKYADPKTGKTWTGFGRVPAWLANVKNRDAYLIDRNQASEAAPEKSRPKTTKASAKRSATEKATASPKSAAKTARKAPVTRTRAKATAKAQPAAESKKRVTSKKAARRTAAPVEAATQDAPPDAQAPVNQGE